MTGKLNLDPRVVAEARRLAALAAEPVIEMARSHTTVSVERATLRLAGLSADRLASTGAGGSDLGDTAGVDERHPVGDLAGEPHLVGDRDHRHAGAGEVAHDV